jgi:hypothetical protein
MVRNLPKGVWVLLVIVLFDIGAIAWLILGRPLNTGWVPGQPDHRPRPKQDRRPVQGATRRPIGPEDSPEFEDRIHRSRQRELEAKDGELSRREREERARRLDEWEAELKRREADLRRREDSAE